LRLSETILQEGSVTDERLKEIGDMLRKAPRKGDTFTDEYGNSITVQNEGVAYELYVGLIHARGDVQKWMRLASPEVAQQLVDQGNKIHRLEHNETIHDLQESLRSATSDAKSPNGDKEG